MEYFVHKDSIVREIWGKGDTVLFVFAGASAEFALNKAVDWLYFTGRLPSDPLGRLFSTVMYAREIVFSKNEKALQTIDRISSIHGAVEKTRGQKIPEWAYRDVLFMLIHYSLAAFELLERKMTEAEKEDLFDVFNRMGTRMNISGLPKSFSDWKIMHQKQLEEDLVKSDFTVDLYKQYRKHLGGFRYWLLCESQKLVVPKTARELLGLKGFSFVTPLLGIYKVSRWMKLDKVLKTLVMPKKYREQIRNLDVVQ